MNSISRGRHFSRVVLRVFCESHGQGCVKWWQRASCMARVAFLWHDICDEKLTEASHETSIRGSRVHEENSQENVDFVPAKCEHLQKSRTKWSFWASYMHRLDSLVLLWLWCQEVVILFGLFCMAGVALRDILTCLLKCRESFCVASAILLWGSQKMIFILRGRRSTLDASCCVSFATPIVRAASSGDEGANGPSGVGDREGVILHGRCSIWWCFNLPL